MKRTLFGSLLIFCLLLSSIAPIANGQTKAKPRQAGAVNNQKRKLVTDKPMKIALPGRYTDDDEEGENDPDMPSFARSVISKEEYKKRRGLEVGRLRGFEEGRPFDVMNRVRSIAQMERQEDDRRTSNKFN